jgi:hypothetical protein
MESLVGECLAGNTVLIKAKHLFFEQPVYYHILYYR